MTRRTMRGVFRPHLLAAAVALGVSAQAYAVSFNIGEIEGSFDSSLSVGASWAVRGPDPDFISSGNVLGMRGESATRTADDNRENFKKGETFSKIFKGLHDLELKYGDSGVFVRGKYWYDFELKDEDRLFYDIDDSGRDRMAKSSGTQLLDAFVYHNYQIGELPGNVRLGKQVVSWGESTFIGNSINSINPIDVAALRRPGAEIKEGLIPVNMFYLSQNLTENLSAEAFYQIEWDHTVIDNCGTFFGNDALPAGCLDRLVVAGPDFAPGDPRANSIATPVVVAGRNIGDAAALAAGRTNAYIPRIEDNDARDGGQFGVALRWFVPELNDTEFGAYALNYHSRSPYLSFKQTTVAPITPAQVGGTPAAIRAAVVGQNQIERVRNARYFIDYPEDIRLYGLSFATNLEGTALGGEVSYRPNMPLQINTADLNLAAIRQTNTVNFAQQVSPVFVSGETQSVAGGDLPGYKRMPVVQAQMTATQFIDQIWGASRLTLVGEVGYNHINGLGSADGTDVRFGRSPIFGAGALVNNGTSVCVGTNPGTPQASNPQQECNDKGFYTSSSWGYRARAILNYSNVFAGINLSPSLAWSHDVDGNGPNFEEGLKAVSLGLDADYANTYTTSLSYTDFFGGEFNTNGDRDFVALSFGVNF
ncbi:DUF1302 domain-containing protein [Pseudomonas cavernae]|uniref:DUF1302 domain-containing protein n=1 Tax=Pseudomonas cavernae TaxID=2320867 RepID=A0A385Z5X3_9PSED|nr:DUF1302 domain-containing protein [Pseudomonas cavernae]AYC34091.1 DUF1302 domain-containing protein [Pseudomonas cavernae]